ncbi:MAG: hypothetical protein E7378_03860 [Clostridiales bacterium]|nr:hypothetical protein [Clostridiales bacterium]
MKSLAKLLQDIQNSSNIAILTHVNPDADALASAIALKKLINNNSQGQRKIIDIFFEADSISDTNAVLIKGVPCNYQRCHAYDLAITVDCASVERLGKYAELFKNSPNTANIDHHTTNTRFAHNNLVLKTSSTCEAIYILAATRNFEISNDICSLIYSGIITDTNNLQQGLITVWTHKIITKFMERKVNIEALNQHFFKNNTKNKSFLLREALNSLHFFHDDRIAIMRLTNQDLDDCGATFDDTVGIVNHGIEIKGVDIAILIIKIEENYFYVSLRSKNNINVAQIAQQLGGGGNEMVAAFQYRGLFNEMSEALIKACGAELKNHSETLNVEDLFLEEEKRD